MLLQFLVDLVDVNLVLVAFNHLQIGFRLLLVEVKLLTSVVKGTDLRLVAFLFVANYPLVLVRVVKTFNNRVGLAAEQPIRTSLPGLLGMLEAEVCHRFAFIS